MKILKNNMSPGGIWKRPFNGLEIRRYVGNGVIKFVRTQFLIKLVLPLRMKSHIWLVIHEEVR